MTLYEKPKTTLLYYNKEYRFFPYFNRVLAIAEEVLPDTLLTAEEKAEIIIPAVSDLPIELDAFELVMHELFPQSRKVSTKKRVMDFTQDAELIYSAFMQVYGIDLYAVQDELDWRVFIALLHGIPETTEFMRVVKIRNTKIPERTKGNASYISSLMEAKRAVALKESEEETAKRMAEAWKSVAERLKQACLTERLNMK